MSSTSPMRGQAGACTSRPFASKRSFHPSQLRGVSQSPWTSTIGGAAGASVAMGGTLVSWDMLEELRAAPLGVECKPFAAELASTPLGEIGGLGISLGDPRILLP